MQAAGRRWRRWCGARTGPGAQGWSPTSSLIRYWQGRQPRRAGGPRLLVEATQDGVDSIDARLMRAQRGELPAELFLGSQARGAGPAPACVDPNGLGVSFTEPAERSGFQLLSSRVHYLGAHIGPTDNPEWGRRERP
jgi:hypothetical protein